MAETIDDIAETAPQQEKKEEVKKVDTLESRVRNVGKETIQFVKALFNLGLAGLIPYAQAKTFPHLARDTAILAGAQVAADATTSIKKGKKYTSGNALESAVVGTAMTPFVYNAFDNVNKIPLNSFGGYLSRAAAFAGIVYPVYIGLYQFIDYVVKNRTLKGVGKYIKGNYWTTLKKAWKQILPFGLANVFLAPAYLQVPISALLSYAFALFGAPKKGEVPEEQKRDKTPYYVAAPNALGKLAYGFGHTFVYSPLKALYEIGSGLAKKIPKPAPATPAIAPAPA